MSNTASRQMRSSGPARGRRGVSPLLPMPASAADHPAVVRLLASIFHSPSSCRCSELEFKASIDDPFHELHDRLVIRCGPGLLGHVLTTRRSMQFGPLRLPAAGLHWLGLAPEIRSQGHGLRLLAAAENAMADQGSLVGLIRTRIPHFFRRSGWALCGRHSHSRAGARDVLAGMIDLGLRPKRHRRRRPAFFRDTPRKPTHVRCLRQMEISALLRIYDRNTLDSFGPLERTAAYWHWLVERRGYDRLYVALDGPNLFELDESRTPIVGYAAIRGEHVLELLVEPDCQRAAMDLLAQACDDAIERGCNCLTYHGRPQDPLHDLFTSVGGTHHQEASSDGQVLMARLLQPARLLHLLAPQLHARVQTARLQTSRRPPPLEHIPGRLTLDVDGRRYAILLARDNVATQTGCAARRQAAAHAALNVADFTRLLLGQFDWAAPHETSLHASNPETEHLLCLLFPTLDLWRPPLDDARGL
ncbi:MAG: GNAT family N-acetyltransferase [Planctomycetota bacterium]|nr:GNAT family N-acetyltransferase [Planctomycetota bacterium]